MKRQQLRRPNLQLKLPVRSDLTGLLLTIIVFIAVAASMIGLPRVDIALVQAAPPAFQDELQIELGSEGFTPAEVQRAAGTFAIAVENSVISGEYTLQLKAQDGTVIKEVQVQKGSAAWTVTLSAGEYTLTEVSHPQWTCRITVQ
jgi:hypothetical protein